MKRVGFILSLFCLLGSVGASAQCDIDYTFYPTENNYGLDPLELPDGVVGQPYEQDLTFYLPLDTTDQGISVTFTDFHITSISLPLGLTWQCNNYDNGCHYDPSETQFGCVAVSGMPLQEGSYDVEVQLIATHSMSSIAGTENVSFTLPLEILPDTSTVTNEGFAMINPSGCAPITVGFVNNNQNMISYSWDFGNGSVSSVENPSDQVFDVPGEYVVNYTATVSEASYFLESITVNAAGCSDGFGAGDPDYFYTITGPSGVLVSVPLENSYSTTLPYTISLPNSTLFAEGQQFTLDLYDDDSDWFSTSYEDCGSITFSPNQIGGVSSTSGGGLSVDYLVTEVPANQVVSSDTIYVYGYPGAANVVYDTLDNQLYTDSAYYAMQWYFQGSPLPNATLDSLTPEFSGYYWLVGINEYGCTSISEEVLVVICNPTYQPIIEADDMLVWMVDSALYDDVQWYMGEQLLLGQTMPELQTTESGVYSINATDTFGCSYTSESLLICNSILQPLIGVNGTTVWVSDSVNYSTYSWSNNGGVVLGADEPILEAPSSGLYAVSLEDAFGCAYASAPTLVCDDSFVPTIDYDGDNLWVLESEGYAIQWFFNGNMLPQETTSVLDRGVAGYYHVQLTDEYGCSYNSSVLNLTEVVELGGPLVQFYPNPVNDYLVVEVVGLNQSAEVSIIDLLGKQLYVGGVEEVIDFSDFSPGIYFVELKMGDKVLLVEKIVKN